MESFWGRKSTLPKDLASWEFPTADFSRCFPLLPESWWLFRTDFSQRKEDCRVDVLNLGQHQIQPPPLAAIKDFQQTWPSDRPAHCQGLLNPGREFRCRFHLCAPAYRAGV